MVRRIRTAASLVRANTGPFERTDRMPRALLAMAPWGSTLGGVVAAASARYPDRIAVRDDDAALDYRTLWARARSVAAGLTARGVGPGTRVGLMNRNHCGFVEWLIAVSVTGADVVLLNTGFAGPQLRDVIENEGIDFVIHDDEFAPLFGPSAITRFDEHAMASFAADSGSVAPRRQQGRMVVLTSGTTGTPKGAQRSAETAAVEGVAAVFERIPLRLGDTQFIAAPMFHGWGLTHLVLGLGRCATTIVTRRFDPQTTLETVSEHDARVLVVVPTMLSRILALSPETLVSAPTPSLGIIASSGSALGSRLAAAALDRFGPVLYNLYGSTEVSVATIATPRDLLRAPATAGRVALGVRVAILDETGSPVLEGVVGRIFVGGPSRFEGYTTGGGKEERDGMLSSGDLGRFEDGLLFVEGREDDMIVSGGENVYPGEVEELLEGLSGADEVVVVGVPDEAFGQALAAFVVRSGEGFLTADDVRFHVRVNLARHKVPRHVEFLDELPRSPTGKVLRRVLRDAVRTLDSVTA